MAEKKPRKRAKRPAETPGPLVPQKHGGAIWQGTPATIVPGPGRPRDEVRAAYLGIAGEEGVQLVGGILRGSVQVRFVGTCPHCRKESVPDSDMLTEVAETVQRDLDRKLKANEQALRFGLGPQIETLTRDEFRSSARERLQQTLAELRHWVPSERYEDCLRAIEVYWQEDG